MSVKLDVVDPGVWRRINRPHPSLNHQEILDGILTFGRGYGGTLTTETMLVHGLNDNDSQARRVGRFVAELSPQTAYLA